MPISALSEGATGQDVILLQDRLKELNYFSAKSTGNFLSITVKAVKDFQKANGLEDNGIVDIDTIIALFSDSAVKKTAQPASTVKAVSYTHLSISLFYEFVLLVSVKQGDLYL